MPSESSASGGLESICARCKPGYTACVSEDGAVIQLDVEPIQAMSARPVSSGPLITSSQRRKSSARVSVRRFSSAGHLRDLRMNGFAATEHADELLDLARPRFGLFGVLYSKEDGVAVSAVQGCKERTGSGIGI